MQPGGLSTDDARRRLAADGPNELPDARQRGWTGLLLDLLREPMLALLVACALLYIVLGEPADAALLGVAVLLVVAITVVQERRTEHALAALREMASPRATVWRDGAQALVPAREVVAGDVIELQEGERVCADALLVDTHLLRADESLLSGESVAIDKDAPAPDEPLRDEVHRVFAGSLVVAGRALAQVEATGPRSRMGRIGQALGSIAPAPTPLQHETASLVRRLGAVALVVCVAVLVLHGLLRGDWWQALLAGLALAMGMLPEELPVVLAVFMALGAWRMARHQVLVRRLASLETLGAATVLAVDKTGTLTENRMRVQQLVDADGRALQLGDGTPLPPAARVLAAHALLATPADSRDPMEAAIRRLAEIDGCAEHAARALWREYPLAADLLAMSRVWSGGAATDDALVATKGAPEHVAALCHLDGAQLAAVQQQVESLAAQGLRVIAVARASHTHAGDPVADAGPHAEGQHGYAMQWLGLLALADPVRASVPDALAQCRTAGVRVLMITGDHASTARAIGRQCGFGPEPRVATGAELDALDDMALAARLRATDIVARAVPETKLRIVRALQGQGEVVAMTGDGVNDAPALKAADIGVAMGRRGSEVAREASAVVVADDDFASIVRAVRMGRRLDRNLRRAMAFIVAVHVPLAGLALLPVLMGWPLILLPAHIAALELLIDPACSVVFELEPGDARDMQHAPRRKSEPLFTSASLWLAALLGALVLAAVAAAVVVSRQLGWPEDSMRGLAFGLLVLGDLALIGALLRPGAPLASMFGRGNRAWGIALVATLATLAALLGVPALAGLFHMAPVTPAQAGAMLAAAAGLLLVMRPLARRQAAD
jgi:Ca2+-transporting ATPase